MLTEVADKPQPQVTARPLTLVDMTTLQDRLLQAMKAAKPPISQADLVRLSLLSRAAVSKWLSGESKAMKAAHVFSLARVLQCNAEWLATGAGDLKAGVSVDARSQGISDARLALIRAYGRLPDEVRFPIRSLIETLATANNENYAKWSREEGVRAVKRDKEKV